MLTRLPAILSHQQETKDDISDPHLISVSTQAKDLQKQFDDIVWECGLNDPRIAASQQKSAITKCLKQKE
jgi:hypothetical protein